ncbi:MAG: hypothetical protein HYY23_18990 [Verrucomicrobia bacterium]|nr:hypothetical protein [Verrucomicrobiota bacterium]
MISLSKNRPPSALMGLTLDKSRIEGVVLRRLNGAVQVQRSFQTSLSLDPLTNDPELVGREIRNHLNEAGVRVKPCAVSVPLNWALTLQTKVPAMPEADVQDFLNIEAEKGFPYAPEDLFISISRFRAPNGDQYATIVAIPRNHLTLLERALRAAQLKPVSFSLGISALQDLGKDPATGLLSLVVGESSVELQVSSGGGVAALRSLEGAIEANGFERHIDADLIAREIKITLGQLPKEVRETVRKIKVFGRTELAQRLVKELSERLDTMGLEIGLGTAQPVNGFPVPIASDKGLSPALGMAARYIVGKPGGFEFLPPRVSPWAQFTARFASRKMVSWGAVAGAAVFLIAGAFLWQQVRLSGLESRWKAIQPRVTELEDLQQRIRKFRPWFDNTARTLVILRKLTEAFPVDGAVTAKTVEIKDLFTVSCSGQAKDRESLLKVLERLRGSKEVADLKLGQIRGNSPLQFSFDLRWREGAAHEN